MWLKRWAQHGSNCTSIFWSFVYTHMHWVWVYVWSFLARQTPLLSDVSQTLVSSSSSFDDWFSRHLFEIVRTFKIFIKIVIKKKLNIYHLLNRGSGQSTSELQLKVNYRIKFGLVRLGIVSFQFWYSLFKID